MEKSIHTHIDSLPKQMFIKMEKSKKKEKKEKKLYDFIDINLDKTFLNNYFKINNKK